MLITQCKLQIDRPKEGTICVWTVQWLDHKEAKLGRTAKYNKKEWTIVGVWSTIDTSQFLPMRRV
jgi:hypothetical protein